MISRVAEACFWLNRYVERAEVLSRMLDVNLTFQLDAALPDAERWRPLVVVAGQAADFTKQTQAGLLDDGETVQKFLVWNQENPSSIRSSLGLARENARTIRETISLEMWETLNELWIWLGETAARRMFERDRHAFYVHVRNQCLLYHGIAQATLLHEDPFRFMRLGTSLERADQTARILDVKYHSLGPTRPDDERPVEAAQWLATLRFCSGFEPFFKRDDAVVCGHDIVGFLLFDPHFPRSVLHNLHRCRNFLNLISTAGPAGSGARSKALVEELTAEIEGEDVDEVIEAGLHGVLTRIVAAAARIGEEVRADFFDPELAMRRGTKSQAQSQTQP